MLESGITVALTSTVSVQKTLVNVAEQLDELEDEELEDDELEDEELEEEEDDELDEELLEVDELFS